MTDISEEYKKMILEAMESANIHDCPDLAPDDITIPRMVKIINGRKDRADRIIRDLVAAGKMEYLGKRINPTSGKEINAWKLITK